MADKTALALGTGERLATASAQRENVEAALDVVRYLDEFADGDAHSAVFVDPERIHERESVLKNLRLVTSGGLADDPRARMAAAVVETQCRQLEKQLLERFRAAVRQGDEPAMQAFAASMFDFDGGDSCVDAFLTEAFALPKSFNQRLPSDWAGGGVRKFFMHATAALERQQPTIDAVFPDPSRVTTTIVEKIFDWADANSHKSQHQQAPFPLSVRVFLERLREATERSAPELYLVLVAEAFDRTKELVQQVNKLPFDRAAVNPERLTEFVFSAARDSYLEKELELQRRSYEAKIASSRGLLSPTVLEERLTLANRFPWEGLVGGEDGSSPSSNQMIRDISLEDLETSKFLLSQCRAALDRCCKLSHAKDVAANVTSLYRLLLQTLCSDWLSRAVDLHLQLISDKASAKRPADSSFLHVVLTVNSIVLDVQQLHHADVLPRVATSINEPTKCSSLLAKLLAQLEQRLSSGLLRLVQAMAAQTEALLTSKQLKTKKKKVGFFLKKKKKQKRYRRDFRPSESAVVDSPTGACLAVCDLVNAQRVSVLSCLDGGNSRMFLRALGGKLFETLVAHLKKQSVSMGIGGAQLLMDLSKYAETVRQFGDVQMDNRLALLRRLANIHLVDRGGIPGLLRDLSSAVAADMRERELAAAKEGAGAQHAGLSMADIKEYLHTHELYNSNWLDFLE